MPGYDAIMNQVLFELGDPEHISVSPEFSRMLCEMCVNILQFVSQQVVKSALVDFPASMPIITGYIPIVEMSKLLTSSGVSIPDVILPLSVRINNLELKKSAMTLVEYFPSAWGELGSVTEYYLLFTNLLGLRRSPAVDQTIELTYVNYIEVLNINDAFPLDDALIQPMEQLLRFFLFSRVSRYQLAERELKRFITDSKDHLRA
jgi:hypothetical protein